VVAGGLLVAGVASTLVSAWIGIRSVDVAVRVVTHPLALTQTQALVTGLLSAHLMLLQVWCLARVPWLERAWGRDVLVRRHRRLAWWSFWLMLVHVGLFTLQAATQELGGDENPFYALFIGDRHMLLATLGTALLVLVVVSSVALARRRLRYETWHLLHLWSYVGMGLALPHMLVSVDFGPGWPTTWWWTTYLLTLAVVLVLRVGLPVWRSVRTRLVVSDVEADPSGAVSVTMTGRGVGRLGIRPGQFFVWRFLGGRGWTRGHPFSVSRATDDALRVTVADAGLGSRRASGVAVGTRVLVEGPYGGFSLERRRHPRVAMLAAGVGVTPFVALVEAATFAPGEATLVVRSRDVGVLAREVHELCAARGVALVELVGPRRSAWSWLPEGVEGGPAEVLARLVPGVDDCDVFLCGPPGWTAAVRTAALRAGVRERDLHEESFSW
jgi:predicted ferric reductase